MKCCLADGFPFVFGLDYFSSFEQSETNGGFVSTPNPRRHEQSNGSHAMLAVGYSDAKQIFIVRNSYGDQLICSTCTSNLSFVSFRLREIGDIFTSVIIT